jgi:diacylglycerol kinase family enzyme
LSDLQSLSEAEDTVRHNETATPRRAHLFVITPRSFRFTTGGTDGIAAEIRSYFKDHAQEECHIHISRYPRDAVGVVRKFAAAFENTDTVIRVYAVGGNGILFDCLNGIVGIANAELATVPYGNTNDFARSFGEDKLPLFRDIAKQVSAGTVKTDIIYCGSNYALNFCTVGVESASIMRTMRLTRMFDWAIRFSRRVVPFMFTLGGIAAAWDRKVREQRYSIVFDGERTEGTYTAINIANGPCYGGNKSAVTSAMPNDGVLDVLLLKSVGALQILKIIPQYLRGGYYKYPEILRYTRVRKAEISSETPILVNLDGEVFFDTSVTIEVMPQAVNIVAVDGLEYRRRSEAREPQ